MPNQSLRTRIKGAWNAFFNKDPTINENASDWYNSGYFYNSTFRPDKARLNPTSERTIISAIYNRIAMDVAAVDIVHARLDEEGRYIETINSDLNNCLSIEANLDQTGRAFIQDIAMSMLDEGSVAIVPVDTTNNPYKTGSYDILSMRTGKITAWHPQHVRVDVYDENTGVRKEIILPKQLVAIVESPLYSVMNDPNSVLQRLLRKLRLLDYIDEQSASSKLNMIIQLPYIIKTEARRVQAENRRKDIEDQLINSPFGIAYTDGTEKITQLSRPLENNILAQVEYLTKMLYDQLGITDEILNGTANDSAMTSYYSRTVEPIISAIADEMKRKFLTKTARSQGQSIEFFRDPFRLVPIADIADIADRFTRNEILSSNEVRQIIGRKPSSDPMADELRNKNLYPVDTNGDGVIDDNDEPLDGETVDEENLESESTDGIDMSDLEDALDSFMSEYEDSDDADYNAISDLDEIDEQLDDLEDLLMHKQYVSPYYDPVKAHEYYMRTRELKGRFSTSGLNETGKEAASYVKENLRNERKRKTSESRELMKSNISKSREKMNAQITKRRTTRDRFIENGRNKLKSILNTLKNTKLSALKGISSSYQTTSKAITARTSSSIKSRNEALKGQIDQAREAKNKKIEAHKNATNSQIDTLRNELKGMSKDDKEKNRERIQKIIDKLREDNKSHRESLNADFKNYSSSSRSRVKNENTKEREKSKVERKTLSDKTKGEKEKARKGYSSSSKSHRTKTTEANKKERESYKKDVKVYRDAHKTRSKQYRDQHSVRSGQYKNEYEQKYESELKKMKSDTRMQSTKKRKKK